ncbi:hypothetical protein [Mucilaginibacter aquatilis]|uniref:Tetratricopeptide repeat protein n=1 Tax=Mucilaginibacter aquatilis TaxID=1517760 RepID=A0A6I4IQM2_9SPHI|nr:hypothetical protein [Mucilaginibacter aquatilis]MVN91933.1 hypothetical protein [Mucilaginibacter aquatilis]
MLLGANNSQIQQQSQEDFIVRLIDKGRFSEAYQLLKTEPDHITSTHFNTALCLFGSKNYKDALISLDRALATLQNKPSLHHQTDANYQSIVNAQNQTDDHLIAVDTKYVSLFTERFKDAVVRLKTDCWLELGEWNRVVETASHIQFKKYRNIDNALQIAHNILDNNE